MFDTFKKNLELKKTERALKVLLMNRLSELTEKEIKNKELETAVLEQVKAQNETISPELLKSFITDMSNLTGKMEQPDFSDELYRVFAKYGHEERMAEIGKMAGLDSPSPQAI